MNHYTSASIKSKVYSKLTKIAKKERRTISDQLDIILDYYQNSNGVFHK